VKTDGLTTEIIAEEVAKFKRLPYPGANEWDADFR
jgi:hypothetical protein